jgi:hypothetical protein
MHDILRRVGRYALVEGLFFMPRERQRRLERWLRGREELADIERADCCLVSYGKSGRTWLRVMLSRFYQQAHQLPPGELLGFDNYKRRAPSLPSVLFTHGNYVRDYTGRFNDRAPFYDKTVVLLVRDPRDIAVSQYFQWKHRMHPRKKWLNRYPDHGAQLDTFEFVMNPEVGLPAILAWLELWQREMGRVARLKVVRYEDLRADTGRVLAEVLAFIGTPATPGQVEDAVRFASLENMKKLEAEKAFKASGARMRPGDARNPDTYKARRAKVGGWRDYFDEAEAARIEALVEAMPPARSARRRGRDRPGSRPAAGRRARRSASRGPAARAGRRAPRSCASG